ncbi:MAG: hypothetical protein J0I43_15610 [Microbacterium sp.]|uniref:hypothetical protein n=1 Tax=Microbacterium sp. TaxID=51671 RepID=UPI001AC9CE6B|nr:hypothetical protein [Microbacterium sp.]MBN9178779.1 hypothetical protein [Microbacterium sp.]
MDPAADRRRRRLLFAAIAGGLALLLLVGLGMYGLLRGPATNGPDPEESASPAAATPAPSAAAPSSPEPIPALSDPEGFARQVAQALFTWDTSSGLEPSDYAQVLADAADTTEANALATDVRTYLPSPEAWAQLRTYQTRQRLTIDSVVVPEAWATAEAQAAPGQIPRGATAYTIEGTRHRTGIWSTEPVEASRPVSFTVFIVCTPPAPEFRADMCRLLRLSALANPLR